MNLSASPFPPSARKTIERGMQCVPAILRENGKTRATADSLADAVARIIKDKFAADQAVRQLISGGMLEWEPKHVAAPSVIDEHGNVLVDGSGGKASLPESGPVPLSLIIVKAADSLWARPKSTSKNRIPKKAADQRKSKDQVSGMMLSKMQEDPESAALTCRQWADHCGCSTSTVSKTPAWEVAKKMVAQVAVGGQERLRQDHST